MDAWQQRVGKGNYCELLALARLVREGYEIAIPYGQQRGWDLLVSVNGKWEKWQVRASRRRKPHFKTVAVNLQSYHYRASGQRIERRPSKESFDVLLAVDPDTGWMWKVNIEDIIGRSTINFMPNSPYRWHNKELSKFFLS